MLFAEKEEPVLFIYGVIGTSGRAFLSNSQSFLFKSQKRVLAGKGYLHLSPLTLQAIVNRNFV